MNAWRWFVSLLFFVEQNMYFGWNGIPKSDAELIADGITMILLSMAIRKPT